MYYFLLLFALRFLRGFCNLEVKLEPFFNYSSSHLVFPHTSHQKE